jgi:predicted GTPase
VRRVMIMGAGGRDFHNFNVVYREDPDAEVVAFTAAQIPGIADRVYPAVLAGPRYPDGVPVLPEEDLEDLIARLAVDEVVFAYSDVSHQHVMHVASRVLAGGADFRLLGPAATMLASSRPVVAVCAVRTGAGKSQTSRRVGRVLREAGLRVALIRHPMPYHDLEAIRVQRFETIDDIDRSNPTIEEREEYERVVAAGLVMYAGVDYAAILKAAEAEADAIVWDGGNNDFSFIRPDVLIVVVDPLRCGQELAYHPGETNLRMADVVVVNKVDSASAEQLRTVMADADAVNPGAVVVRAASPVSLGEGPSLAGKAVLVVEDGPTITHGGMPFGAGTVAAQQGGARIQVDPRKWAVGSIGQTLDRYQHIGRVLPAMGYSAEQLQELEATINAADCDIVVAGTPVDLARLINCRHPIRQAVYELQEVGEQTIEQALAPIIARAQPT